VLQVIPWMWKVERTPTMTTRARNLLAVLLFLLSCLSGAGALNMAFLRSNHSWFAIVAFVVAAALWLGGYQGTPTNRSWLRTAGVIILIFWAFNLCIALAADFPETVRNPFFWVATLIVISLISAISLGPLSQRRHDVHARNSQ
jgi:hypothetical protein